MVAENSKQVVFLEASGQEVHLVSEVTSFEAKCAICMCVGQVQGEEHSRNEFAMKEALLSQV